MSATLKPSLQRRVRHALGSLFREARRLERRRRRRYAAAGLLACAITSGGGFLIANNQGGTSTSSPDHPIPPLVSSLALPKAGDYFALAIVGGRVIVSGGPEGSLFPSGSTTSLSDGRAVGTCDAATVNPVTFKLGPVAHANCGDPALYRERVLAVSYLEQSVLRDRGIGEFSVRIAHVDPRAPDGYRLGPVVMTYPQCSDCSAEWIYGDGSLWLYGPYDGYLSRPHTVPPSELLRVSASTGKVVQRWAIPPNSRELLAVDADGLWFAPSVEGGEPAHTTAAQMIRYESLYLVTPGARAPRRVFKIGAGGARWLVAAGHTVWLAANTRHGGSTLWRLQGPNATPTFRGRYSPNADQVVDIGEAPSTHAGNAAIGIYYVAIPGFGSHLRRRQEVIRLSPDTTRQQIVTTVPAPPDSASIDNYYGSWPPAVAVGRSFYFLDPQVLSYRSGGRPPMVQGRAVLYRVAPRATPRAR